MDSLVQGWIDPLQRLVNILVIFLCGSHVYDGVPITILTAMIIVPFVDLFVMEDPIAEAVDRLNTLMNFFSREVCSRRLFSMGENLIERGKAIRQPDARFIGAVK